MSSSHNTERDPFEDDEHEWIGHEPKSFSSFFSSPPDPSRESRASSSFSWIGDSLAIEVDSPAKKSLPVEAIPYRPAHRPPTPASSLNQQSSTSKTGLGVLTRFSSDSIPTENPTARPSLPLYQLDRGQVQFNGTGPHDDLLARSLNNTRQDPFQVKNTLAVQQSEDMPRPKHKHKQKVGEHGLWFTKVSRKNKPSPNSKAKANQPSGQANSSPKDVCFFLTTWSYNTKQVRSKTTNRHSRPLSILRRKAQCQSTRPATSASATQKR